MAEPLSLPSVIVVTGTGTDLGKTMTTAALAVVLRRRGLRVAVVKPAQTGVTAGEPGDIDVVRRLLGTDPEVTTHEFVRLRDPLAPDTAARREGVELPSAADHARRVTEIAAGGDVVLVEGAGGLLVRLDAHGATLADVGTALRDGGVGVGYVVVVGAGLGTLNHTALTAEALAARSLPLLGVVIGSWPDVPSLAEECNLEDLPRVAGAPLLGRLPAGIGALPAAEFRARVPDWLAVEWSPGASPP